MPQARNMSGGATHTWFYRLAVAMLISDFLQWQEAFGGRDIRFWQALMVVAFMSVVGVRRLYVTTGQLLLFFIIAGHIAIVSSIDGRSVLFSIVQLLLVFGTFVTVYNVVRILGPRRFFDMYMTAAGI